MLPSLSIFPSKDQSNFLWRTSWISFISAIYAFYQSHYMLALVPAGVFLTSINYWYHPDYSWRRYVDIMFVIFAIIYQTRYAFSHNAEHLDISLVFMGAAAQFYLFGIYFYSMRRYWLSAYCHSGLHLFANIANIVLYSGKI
jgi:hypothetical protein